MLGADILVISFSKVFISMSSGDKRYASMLTCKAYGSPPKVLRR